MAGRQPRRDYQPVPRRKIGGGITENLSTQSDSSERKSGEDTPTNTQEVEPENREPGPAQEEEPRRSDRERKDTVMYLREKYPGCVLKHG